MFYFCFLLIRPRESVTDFLSAGRTAGRYLISVSSGIAGLGAISVVMFLEMGYVAGFSLYGGVLVKELLF